MADANGKPFVDVRVPREGPIKTFPSAAQGYAAKFDGVSR